MTDPRWDPELLALQRATDAAAAAHPPPDLATDPQGMRAWSEAMNLPFAAGGPAMAESRDLWLPLRGRRVQCRLHRPSREAPLPVLVYLHGGGWVTNSIDTHDRLARTLAAESGWAVLSADYAMAPEARFPVAVAECAALARWLESRAAGLGLDPDRIVLGGDSAGANLAIGAALDLGPDAARPRGLLLFYGVYDARFDTPSYREFDSGYGLTAARMRTFWDLYAPREADRADPRCAPLRAVSLAGLPPCLLLPAELDVLRSEGAAMAERLRRDGVVVSEHPTPGAPHGFARLVGRSAAADAAVRAAASWLQNLG